MKNLKASIIIAAYNEERTISQCLDSIISINTSPDLYEVILVDNNSTDNTIKIAKKYPIKIFIEKKRGAIHARNLGIEKAINEILVFIDADVKVTENWLNNLLKNFEDESIGGVGGAIQPFKETIVSKYLGASLFLRYPNYSKKQELRGYPSCNLAIRRCLLNGGLDTKLLQYGEDQDLCYQILEKQYKIVYEPSALVYHEHPTKLFELVRLCVKSSRGRVKLYEKYRTNLVSLVFNYHIITLYFIFIILSFFVKFSLFFLLILLPISFLFLNSIISYRYNKGIIQDVIFKTLLDTLSIFVIYVSYNYYKHVKKHH